MNCSGIIFPALGAYDGMALEIYVSGCERDCKGCHSPELQDFNHGKYLDIYKLIEDIKLKENWIDIISLLGGDPLQQDESELMRLVVALKSNFPDKKLWMFTGGNKEEVPLWVLEFFDKVKVGKFDIDLYQEGAFPASSNQLVLRKGVDY